MNYLKLSKFFLYLVPFSVVVVFTGTLFPFIVGKYVFFRTAVGLALIFYLLALLKGETLINADKKPIYADKKTVSISQNQHKSALWRQPLIIAVSVFVLIFLLAGFFGYNPSASFWSNFERGEGGLQILFLFIFFILLVLLFEKKDDWYRLFKISLIAGVAVILYGVLAALDIRGFIGPLFGESDFRFAGSLGNSAYIGTYLIFAIFYALYLFTEVKWKKVFRYLLIGGVGVFMIFLFLSGTRGAFLGLGAGVLSGLLYLFFKLSSVRIRKIILISLVALFILSALGFVFRPSLPLLGDRLFNISISAGSFQTRLLLWQQSIKIFKERPILGWGPENFAPAFEKHYDPFFKVWYDRAHNIFFDYLVFSGIFGLLSFISIFGVFYRQFFKFRPTVNSRQSIFQGALLFALPVAYLVQGLVLFDVLPIYINLFMFLAFSNYKFSRQF